MAKQKINQEQSSIVYTTSESLTGDFWIDGKPIYRKRVYLGAMPNATSKTVAHGITTIETIISLRGVANGTSAAIPLPYAHTSSTLSVVLYRDGGDITVQAGTDRSSYTGFVIIEYTKT